jgi:hypothetical protein
MEQIPPVLINNEKVNGPQKIADTINNFFLKITENLALHQEAFLKNTFNRKFPDLKIIPTIKMEISIIHSLQAKKTTGYDGITSKILKACASLISHPLTHICKHSLLMGTFPNWLTVSVVRPLNENDDKTNMSKL